MTETPFVWGDYDGSGPLPTGDILLGGAGNDVLVEQSVWNDSPGSVLDGGAGDDTYVLNPNTYLLNAEQAYQFVNNPANAENPIIDILLNYQVPTRIVERTAGVDSGGSDTIKFKVDRMAPLTYTFNADTTTVTVKASSEFYKGQNLIDWAGKGEFAQLDFISGAAATTTSTLDAFYKITDVVKDADDHVTSFTVATSNVNPTALGVTAGSTGSVMAADFSGGGTFSGFWMNSDTYSMMAYRGTEMFDGEEGPNHPFATAQNTHLAVDQTNNIVGSPFAVLANIDRTAMDFFELSNSELTTGMRYKMNFGQGALDTGTEIIVGNNNYSTNSFGGKGSDWIVDTLGNDILMGGDGNDAIFSDYGRDVLVGGNGDDFLNVLSSDQVLIGGAGADTFMIEGKVANTDGVATIMDFNAGQGDTIEISKDFIHHLLTKSNNFNGQEHYDSLEVYFDSNNNSTYTTFGLRATGVGGDVDIDLFNLVLPASQNPQNVVNSIDSALSLQVLNQSMIDLR
jgi:Ca2+-binding RTX toxin-like protein